jgi:hypothetical protein
MRLPAPSASTESARPAGLRAGAGAALAAALLGAGHLASCALDEYPDRDPLVVEGAPVDSLEFLPPGARYVLADSAAGVLVKGYRPGYACTEITAMGLERRAGWDPPGYVAKVGFKLPAEPTCPLLDSARDSVVAARFGEADGPVARLLDSAGRTLDEAGIVRGTLSTDSLVHVAPALTASKGRFTYRDSSGFLGRQLFADSLGPCELLNHADFSERRDTTVVRYSWVTLDPVSAPDSCAGPTRQDTLTPLPARNPAGPT